MVIRNHIRLPKTKFRRAAMFYILFIQKKGRPCNMKAPEISEKTSKMFQTMHCISRAMPCASALTSIRPYARTMSPNAALHFNLATSWSSRLTFLV